MTPSRKVYGVCPHDCPDTCGTITEVRDGRAVAFYADPDQPLTGGWLCAKVRPYLDHVYHPERLLYPLRRTSGKGEPAAWRPITWEEALDEIGARWRAIIARYGAEAILPYSYSGTLGLLQMGVASGRFWNRLGASRLERAICGDAAAAAVNFTLGARRGVPYDHVADSRLVLIWGHNPVSTAPHFMPHLVRARRQGTQVVVIDPRRTRSAAGVDWHLQPRPATDGALALGLAHLIFAENLHDEAWLEAHALGWREYRQHVEPCTPAWTAAETGLAETDIRRLAHLYATTRPALLKFGDGINRHQNGGQTCRALAVLPALIGQYGVRGGGLGYSTSGYFPWDAEAVDKWGACPQPPTRKVNMNRLGAALTGEVTDPPVMSLFVFGANPLAASPNAALIRRGMERPDLFTVVHELFMTDTAEMADIVLPATGQLEQLDLHRAYGHTRLILNEPALAPPGDCRSNWDTMRALAGAMGFGEPWLHDEPETVIDEVLRASSRAIPELDGVSVDFLRGRPGGWQVPFAPEVPFADGRYPTPSGRVEIFSAPMAALGHDPLPTYHPAFDPAGLSEKDARRFPAGLALTLISGAAHHFTTTTFANSPAMVDHEGTPFVEIHPQDAAVRGIVDGETVAVENGRGCVTLRAVVTDRVRPGVVISPKGRWANRSGGRNVNWLTPDALADLAGQSTFHTNRVWITKEK